MSTKAAAATPIEKKTRVKRTAAQIAADNAAIEAARKPAHEQLADSIARKRADIANLKENLALAEKDLKDLAGTLEKLRDMINLEVE